MKTPSIINAILFASALTATISAVPSHAQTNSPNLSVTVPFGFELGSHHLAPGTYTIARPFENILAVRNRSDSGMNLTRWEDSKPASAGKVVFHRYGNRYFLREVWPAMSAAHLECSESKQERQVRRSQIAVVLAAPKDVELALLHNPQLQP